MSSEKEGAICDKKIFHHREHRGHREKQEEKAKSWVSSSLDFL